MAITPMVRRKSANNAMHRKSKTLLRAIFASDDGGRYMPESTKSTAAIMSERYEERSCD